MAASRELADLQSAARKAPRSLVKALPRTREAGEQPLRGAFIARSLNALSRLTEEMDEGALGEAVSSPSDYEALLRAHETPDALEALRRRDPLLPAKLRGLRNRGRLLGVEGPALTAEEAAPALGITRQDVDKRRRAGRLLAVTLGRRGYLYPTWQFTTGGVLSRLEEVPAPLRDHDSWMQLAFMGNPNVALRSRTPLAELREDDLAAVLRDARTHGEQVAVWPPGSAPTGLGHPLHHASISGHLVATADNIGSKISLPHFSGTLLDMAWLSLPSVTSSSAVGAWL